MPKPVIFFTDFDGTITLQDSNDYLTENIGFGRPRRLEINELILNELMLFRDGFQQMLDSVTTTFPDCIQLLLENIQLDPGFKDFYHWATERKIPIVVVLSGMVPIIKALLAELVGPDAMENIEILANDVKIEADGLWDIVFRDDSDFGHDKSKSIRDYLAQHNVDKNSDLLFYAGDGVSDISAAKETDLLIAKEGKDLIIYSKREGIPYTTFRDYSDILRKVEAIVAADGTNIKDFLEN